MIALADLAPEVDAELSIDVSGIALDSRDVSNGDLFLALAGTTADGHEYIPQAVANGAAAVFAQHAVADCAVPLVILEDLSERASAIASTFFGHPSAMMTCVAVTGTNGKTSVAHFVAQLAAGLGVPAGFLGTTGWGAICDEQELQAAPLTTADAVALQKRLHSLQQSGVQLVAMELSSHALQQHRADAVAVDVALFTNLSRDHLDYHQTMEAYGAAKARLFGFASLAAAVVNVDDAYGDSLFAQLIAANHPAEQTFALGSKKTGSLDPAKALCITDLTASSSGLEWQLDTPWGSQRFSTPVVGEFNAINLSLAVAALMPVRDRFDYTLADLAAVLRDVDAPPGRLQRVSHSGTAAGPAVFVDYAHTPDALSTVLQAVRSHCAGRLICVFGCGGDRDKGKRVPMGRAVAELADVGWLTSDNPRFEDPLNIIADVERGLPDNHSIRSEPDRRRAIERALGAAGADDVVVIAGKGHEDYQDVAGIRQPFDDVLVAAELLRNRQSPVATTTRGMH